MNAHKHIKLCLSLFSALLFACAGPAGAFEASVLNSKQLSANVMQEPAAYSQSDSNRALPLTQYSQKQFSQNKKADLRSRSDVVKEVKSRYDAEVLRVSLNERRMVYEVRVLMPNGKVRNLTVSAKR